MIDLILRPMVLSISDKSIDKPVKYGCSLLSLDVLNELLILT
ncbi:hypothetical protein [Streptococcus agalactiae]|nr:hypothetical protein [Streptococcus agalactiae]